MGSSAATLMGRLAGRLAGSLSARLAGSLAMILAALLAATAASARQAHSQGQPAAASSAVGQINGTLHDPRRKGAPGLSVAVIAQPGAFLYGTTSDEGGRYLLKGLETGTYSVVVAAPAGVARKDGIRVRPLFRSIVDFNVPADLQASSLPSPGPLAAAAEPGGSSLTISCLLTDRDRAPVPDAAVLLTPVAEAGRPRRARTGGDGRCRLADVPPGTYRIAARAPGFMTWSHGPLALEKPGDLTLALTMVIFPMGFEGTLDDLLIPADPVPPGTPAPEP